MISPNARWPRIFSFVLWLLLVTLAFGFGPARDPNTGVLIKKMLVFDLDGVNQSLFALFNLMGVMPMVCACLLAFDGTARRWLKWPFVIASFALGAYALLPYLVLRTWGLEPRTKHGLVLRFFGSTILSVILMCAGGAFGLQFLFAGDLASYFSSVVPNSKFAFAMSLDFIALSVAAVLLILEQSKRIEKGVLASIPAVGPAASLAWMRLTAPKASV
jgi:hypothetical protein